MHNIGVIGDYDSVFGFRAVGFDVFPVDTPQQAQQKLNKLAELDYRVVFMTENVMREHELLYVVPIPGVGESQDLGQARLKQFVEQAVGADILHLI